MASRDVPFQAVRQLTVYILPHSHTDIGYTAIQTDIEEKQINNLLQGLAAARRTADYPAGARFRLERGSGLGRGSVLAASLRHANVKSFSTRSDAAKSPSTECI